LPPRPWLMSCLSDKYIDSSASAKTNLRSTNIDSSAFLPETNPRSTSISTRLPFSRRRTCDVSTNIDSSASATNPRLTNIDSSAFLFQTNPRSTRTSTRLPFSRRRTCDISIISTCRHLRRTLDRQEHQICQLRRHFLWFLSLNSTATIRRHSFPPNSIATIRQLLSTNDLTCLETSVCLEPLSQDLRRLESCDDSGDDYTDITACPFKYENQNTSAEILIQHMLYGEPYSSTTTDTRCGGIQYCERAWP
jgi:hypothetical protein